MAALRELALAEERYGQRQAEFRERLGELWGDPTEVAARPEAVDEEAWLLALPELTAELRRRAGEMPPEIELEPLPVDVLAQVSRDREGGEEPLIHGMRPGRLAKLLEEVAGDLEPLQAAEALVYVQAITEEVVIMRDRWLELTRLATPPDRKATLAQEARKLATTDLDPLQDRLLDMLLAYEERQDAASR